MPARCPHDPDGMTPQLLATILMVLSGLLAVAYGLWRVADALLRAHGRGWG